MDNSTTTTPAPEPQRRRSTRAKPSGDQLDDLRTLPEIRSIPWKAGQELSPEQSIEAQRVQTKGACLLATRGQVRDPPCSHCSKDLGRFTLCIALDDWFNGACATCQLATRANQCEFRKPDTLRLKSEDVSRKHDSKTLNSIPHVNMNPTISKETQLEPAQNHQTQNGSSQLQTKMQIPPESSVESSGRKKRKRKSEGHKAPKEQLQPILAWKAYESPCLPPAQATNGSENTIQPKSQPSTPIIYTSPYVLPPPDPIVQRPRQPPVAINSVYQKDDIQGHYRHYQPIAKAQRALPPINHNNTRPQPSQSSPRSAFKPIHSRERDATESLSPSIQLLQPTYSPPDPHIPVNVIIPKPMAQALTPRPISQPSNTSHANDSEKSLIDLLPRKKQKQIYGMIGGLQSGIRSCQQQADNMQRQLNALQAALGVDAEDGDLIGGI